MAIHTKPPNLDPPPPNTVAIAILGPIAKLNSCQYFRLYSIKFCAATHLVARVFERAWKQS